MKNVLRVFAVLSLMVFMFAEIVSFGASPLVSLCIVMALALADVVLVKQYGSGTLAMRYTGSGIGMSNFSGSLGSSVASHGRYQAYVRLRTKPHNPNTSIQNTRRASFRSFSQLWRGLTAAQRASWNAGGVNFPKKNRTGKTIILSGFNLYVSLNQNIANIGGTAITTCPNPGSVLTPLGVAITYAAGVATATWTSGVVPAGTTWECWATPGLSAGKSFVKSQFRLVTTFPAATVSGAGVAIFSASYTALFGVAPVGSKVFMFLKAVIILTGQTSKSNIASVVAS